MRTVRKAVIPAAGLGTRFLPATKSVPKEMLPVIDRPAIQYVVEEAVRAGLTDILIVTGRTKRAVEEHFDRNIELELLLERDGKHELLQEVQYSNTLADVHYVRQREALGLGHAVSVARHHVGDEPFAVLLPDDLMIDDSALLRSMVEAYVARGNAVVSLQEVPPEDISSYGCADPIGEPVDGIVELRGIIEKPERGSAPSNFAVSGRYLFPPDIFEALDRIEPGRGGELQLTDAIALLMEAQPVYGAICTFGRYDVGQKLDFLKASVELALDRDDLGPQFAAYLKELVQRRGLA
ncbi:MAG: UTP--glucose-1-phosphate uridylyltransferase GalU [Acidimicrobiia bacterium]